MEQVGGWRKGPWTPQEDKLLIQYISQNGEGRWSSVCKCTGLKRSGKSCRLRWVNYLRPGLKKGQLTPQEEGIIIELHSLWGNKWSTIARYLPGRTDNEIKNYWRTHFKTRNRNPSHSHSHSKQQKMQQQQSETDDVKLGFTESPNSTKEVEEDDEIAMMMNNDQAAIASDFIPMDCYLWDGLWNLDDDDGVCSKMLVDGNQPNNVANYYHPFEGDTHTLDYVQSQTTGLLLL